MILFLVSLIFQEGGTCLKLIPTTLSIILTPRSSWEIQSFQLTIFHSVTHQTYTATQWEESISRTQQLPSLLCVLLLMTRSVTWISSCIVTITLGCVSVELHLLLRLSSPFKQFREKTNSNKFIFVFVRFFRFVNKLEVSPKAPQSTGSFQHRVLWMELRLKHSMLRMLLF